MEGAAAADATPTPAANGPLSAGDAKTTNYFAAKVVWVTGPFAKRDNEPALPAKVEAIVPVRAASLDTACVEDLKKGVFSLVQREHHVSLPVDQQKLILNGKLLLDDSALLLPLGAIHDTPAAASKSVAVFVVCPVPKQAEKVPDARAPAPAAEPVEVEVELSQLLRHTSLPDDHGGETRKDRSVNEAPELKADEQDAAWIVKVKFVPNVTTFGSFVGSIVKAFGRRAERRDDMFVFALLM